MVGVGGVCWSEFVTAGGGFVGVFLSVGVVLGYQAVVMKEGYHWLALDFSFTIPAKTGAFLARI